MTQGERVKIIRKNLGLTLEKFGEPLGLKKGTLSAIETGRNTLTEQNIKSICREFNIREEWLRDGEEPMTYAKDKNQIIAEFAADLIKEPETFKTRLFKAMANFDEKDWLDIERLFDKLFDKLAQD